jgi:hypothetical protein
VQEKDRGTILRAGIDIADVEAPSDYLLDVHAMSH